MPANCTSVFERLDVILQRLFKHAFWQEFHCYASDDIDKQLRDKTATDVKIDIKMPTLKLLLCDWLIKAWAHVYRSEMIKISWSQCELLRSFDQTFQVQAMDEYMKIPLFDDDSSVLQIESDE